MVEGLQELMPSTFVGHLGMYRDPDTHEPHEHYAKMPDSIAQRDVLVVDPMLAPAAPPPRPSTTCASGA